MKSSEENKGVEVSEKEKSEYIKSCQKTIVELKQEFKAGHYNAAYKLGLIYMNSCLKDYERAYYWFDIGAQAGDGDALYYLSKFYEFDLLDKYDLSEAYRCLKAASDQGEVRAILRLAIWYRMGIYVVKDERLGWNMILKLADRGIAEACFLVAQEYEVGTAVVTRDIKLSLFYYECAANRNHPDALCKMGIFYWEGRFLQRNPLKAIRFLEDSCLKGCAEAQYYLSTLCSTDIYYHLSRRPILLTAAARANHVKAMYDLACMYLFGGKYFQEDREKAEYWFRKAAQAGCREAKEICSVAFDK